MTDAKNRRTRSMLKIKEEPGLDFKDAKYIQQDFDTFQKTIANEEIEYFSDLIKSSDLK
jgi:hypothetical protein